MRYHEWTQAAFEAAERNGVQFEGGQLQNDFVAAIGRAWQSHKTRLKNASPSEGRQLAESYLVVHPETGTVEVH